jgi:hypothetical protein
LKPDTNDRSNASATGATIAAASSFNHHNGR